MKTQVISVVLLAVFMICTSGAIAQGVTRFIEESRNNTVRVTAPELMQMGTGFFLDSMHVVTCFHVIASIEVVDSGTPQLLWEVSDSIVVTLSDGEAIPAACASIPSPQDTSPVLYDFAILSLRRKPKVAHEGLSLHKANGPPAVGSEILFSGYPLGTPTVLTHRGYISGVTDDHTLMCIQAPVNKGISGGALLSAEGEVIGILNSRAGGISPRLEDVVGRITDLEEGRLGFTMDLSMAGVNTLGVTKELIVTLDTYISTGVGFACSIKPLQDYCMRNPGISR